MSEQQQLHTLAMKALMAHGDDIDKALPDFIRATRAASLINELARAYLRQVVTRGADQAAVEAQGRNVSSTPSRASRARPPVAVRKHARQRPRTHGEIEAARMAALAGANAVFEMLVGGRAIGQIRFGELATLHRDLISSAAHGLKLHTVEVRDAIIAELIEGHCTVPNQLMTVSEVIDAPTLELFVQQANQEAPRRIAEAMHHAVAAMERKQMVLS